jgi:hypothetical protein
VTSVRKAAPESLRQAGRQAYVRMGTTTAWLRLQPDFILIGVQRGGTTSLFRALMAHPQVVRPTFHKGVNYFDLNYHRGMNWYRGHFPIAEIARRTTARYGGPVVCEASGYYIYHPFALERIARDMPAAKLVAILRDPVERAFSAYKHESARGYEWESFDRAIELEDERLVGEIDRMRNDICYESFCHRHHSYRHRGQYAEQLERVYKLFPSDQLHIMESEAFFDQPAAEYARLTAFLGLRPFQPASFDRYNARPGAPAAARTWQMLKEHYAPHDERLTELLGRPPRWTR